MVLVFQNKVNHNKANYSCYLISNCHKILFPNTFIKRCYIQLIILCLDKMVV